MRASMSLAFHDVLGVGQGAEQPEGEVDQLRRSFVITLKPGSVIVSAAPSVASALTGSSHSTRLRRRTAETPSGTDPFSLRSHRA